VLRDDLDSPCPLQHDLVEWLVARALRFELERRAAEFDLSGVASLYGLESARARCLAEEMGIALGPANPRSEYGARAGGI
jgi:hypothetical protein